jgi:hypothetical protein
MYKRKGDPTDIPLFLIIIFFVAISVVVALYVNGIIQNDVIGNTALNTSSAYSSINESFNNINVYATQRAFVLFFGLLVVGILVSSFLIRVHSAFIFIYIITLGTAILVSVYLANTYALVVSNPEFASFAANYATITWMMQHIVKILIGVGALSMVIIFGKIGGGNSVDI